MEQINKASWRNLVLIVVMILGLSLVPKQSPAADKDRELEEAYQLLRRVTLTKPYPTIDGIKTILNDLMDQIPAAKTADPKDIVDIRFLEELDRSGYIDRLYR